MRQRLGQDLNQPIYLQADGDVRFAVVVKVMDTLREYAFTNIQIVTRPMIQQRKP